MLRSEPVRLARPQTGALSATVGIGALLAAALAVLPLEAPSRAAAFGLYALVAALAVSGAAAGHPHRRFGLANTLTLLRAGGAAALAALAMAPQAVDAPLAWAAVAAAAALLALDGIDGWAARRQRLVSNFGARFDMEVDALLILVLAALVAGLDKAGVWVLGIGLMRYGFVLAGLLWPVLARPLPPSRWRQAVCVLQVCVLGLLLAPPVVPPVSQALAAAALAALAWSFARDLRRLATRAAA